MPRLRTFLVEDSPVIRQNLIAALEEMSQVTVVGHADDAAQALAWLAGPGDACDLLIVDVFLRKSSGLEVLRQQQGRPEAPARVVLTNYATPDIRRQCLALGADAVFDKSSDIELLINYCDRLAASRSAAGA